MTAKEFWNFPNHFNFRPVFRSSVYEDAASNYLVHCWREPNSQRIVGLSPSGGKVFDYAYHGDAFRSILVHWERLMLITRCRMRAWLVQPTRHLWSRSKKSDVQQGAAATIDEPPRLRLLNRLRDRREADCLRTRVRDPLRRSRTAPALILPRPRRPLEVPLAALVIRRLVPLHMVLPGATPSSPISKFP